MLQIRIRDDGTPLYQQVIDQVRHRILSGRLIAGDEMPAIRTLAADLRVNPNTIARAYRELAAEGLLEVRRTRGTFVAGIDPALSAEARGRLLAAPIESLVTAAIGLGLTGEQLTDLISRSYEAARPSPRPPRETTDG